jgi:hypothetical protein
MKMRNAGRILIICAVTLLPGALVAGGKFDGNWITHLAC